MSKVQRLLRKQVGHQAGPKQRATINSRRYSLNRLEIIGSIEMCACSSEAVKLPNGSTMKLDALNFTLPLDQELTNLLKDLEPHKSCFELDKPRTISGNLSVPKTVVATISNWMHSEDIVTDSMSIEFLNAVCDPQQVLTG